ncbi:hypothetical protein H2203_006243 [Taxawa tesnikishii (nom. ined.)]|nr:hypothetical protein H2203_006243 [Dothideales sp. JES 119]
MGVEADFVGTVATLVNMVLDGLLGVAFLAFIDSVDVQEREMSPPIPLWPNDDLERQDSLTAEDEG